MARGARGSASPPRAGRAAVVARLHSAALHLLRRVRVVDEELGLPPARASALSVLVFGGARSLGALAAAEGVSPATMSAVVAALVEQGLVRRGADPADGRAVRLEATAVGRRLMARGRARRLALLRELLDPLSADDVARLGRAAELMEAAAGRAARPAPVRRKYRRREA